MTEYIPAFLMLLLAAGTSAGLLVATTYVGPRHHHTKEKSAPFESGEQQIASPRLRFDVKFYLVALLFVIFDIEAVFLYPWAVLFQELGFAGFVEMVLFIVILGGGLIYVWKRGALEWE